MQCEAIVQRDPTKAEAWYELGVRHQENEREHKAIQALSRAVELDPSFLQAWLALAVSYTNEGHKSGTYDAIERWIRQREQQKGIVGERVERMRDSQWQGQLIAKLIGMARAVPEGEVDADVQIALGVVLNTGEVRACFHHRGRLWANE